MWECDVLTRPIGVQWPDEGGETCFEVFPTPALGVFSVEPNSTQRHIFYEAYLDTETGGPAPLDPPRPGQTIFMWLAIANGTEFGFAPAIMTWDPRPYGWPGGNTCTIDFQQPPLLPQLI